jgi:hypothetical protein
MAAIIGNMEKAGISYSNDSKKQQAELHWD